MQDFTAAVTLIAGGAVSALAAAQQAVEGEDFSTVLRGLGPYVAAVAAIYYMLTRSDKREERAETRHEAEVRELRDEVRQLTEQLIALRGQDDH